MQLRFWGGYIVPVERDRPHLVICVVICPHDIQDTPSSLWFLVICQHRSLPLASSQPHNFLQSAALNQSDLNPSKGSWESFFFFSAPCWSSKKLCNNVSSPTTLLVVTSPASPGPKQWELQGFESSLGSTWQRTLALPAPRPTKPI